MLFLSSLQIPGTKGKKLSEIREIGVSIEIKESEYNMHLKAKHTQTQIQA